VLLGVTAAVFWPVRRHEFITFDDPNYVTQNLRVQAGLTWSNVAWAFQTTSESNWHPLTWLSHMLDCQMFDLNSGAHHLGNVFFHLINSLLLFAVFKRMTGARWPSAFVAALFALHPLHVESVAWVAERKDVLSGLFWILTIGAYARYVERPSVRRYSLSLLFFALGLMSKPMLVTLPCVLLLLDFWPLNRIRAKPLFPSPPLKGGQGRGEEAHFSPLRLILEKIPFVLLAAASSLITFLAQKSGETVITMAAVPVAQRLANAAIAYVRYMEKTVWPDRLSVFYPYVRSWPAWQVTGAVLILGALTWVAYWGRRNHRYLTVGWLWFVGTLVPVIGFVQVGAQSLADRYTYVPLVGLFVMVSWGAVDLFQRRRSKKLGLPLLASAALSICLVLTVLQVRFWQDTVTLFEHALAVTSGSATIYFNLAYGLLAKGRADDAVPHFLAGLKRDPRNYWIHSTVGDLLSGQGKLEAAVAEYSEALRYQPAFVQAHSGLALAFLLQGKNRQAITEYREVLRLAPDAVNALNNLAWILATNPDETLRNGIEAVRCAERACDLTGRKESIYLGTLAAAYAEAGRFPEAVSTAEKAAELASAAGQKDLVKSDQTSLELYRAGKPYRETSKP
jgi:Tfp pilus assembly protein PilF